MSGDTAPPAEGQVNQGYATEYEDVTLHVPQDSDIPDDPPPYNSVDNGPATGYDPAKNGSATRYDEDKNGNASGFDEVIIKKPNGAGPVEDLDDEKESGCCKSKKKKEPPKLIGMMDLFRFSDKYDYLFMILGTACACGHGVAMPILLLVFGLMTDSFVNTATTNATTLSYLIDCDVFESMQSAAGNQTEFVMDYDNFESEVQKYAVYFVADGICVIGLAYGQVMFWLTTSYRQAHRVRLELLKAVLRQDIGWFDTNDAGELGSRLSDDVNKIQEGIGDKIGGFMQWLSTFVVAIIIGLSKGWKLALVILSVSPLIVFFGALMMFVITLSSEKESEAYAKAGAIAEEVLSSMRTVVAFGGHEKECKRYSENLFLAKTYGIRKAVVGGGGMGCTYLVIFLTYALAFWYGGTLIRSEPGHYTVGVMLIVFFCVVFGAMALGNAAPNLQNIATARGSAYSIWEIIDRKPIIDSSSDEGLSPTTLTGNITVNNVTFKYPSRPDTPILQGLTLEIKRGQTVALVGSSGCGKSTVIQLIQRFYNPLSGDLRIDGVDIKDLNIKWLRNHIGVVSQEPNLFATTIGENISYGRDGVTQEEIERATREANAYDFISKLPKKFDTLVGERGAQLSGGQKQRIAIARALVRDPKILLLDEATSALDTESEATVQAALDNARQGRTTIVVAHRLSTIKTADIIYGIKDGVAHECGTHDELMEKEGIYYQLVTRQQIIEEDSDSEPEEEVGVSAVLSRSVSQNHSRRSLRRRGDSVVSNSMVEEVEQADEEIPDVSMSRVFALNKSEWYYIAIGSIMALLHSACLPAFGLIFGHLLGVFAKCKQENEDGIFLFAMMFILIGGVTAITMVVQNWMFGVSGETLTVRLRQMTFRALLRQEIGYFDDPKNPTGALTTRLATDAAAVQGATGHRLGMVMQAFGALGTGIIIGFIHSWKFTLFIIGVVPFLLIASAIQIKIAKGFSGKNNKALEAAGKVAIEAISNIRTVAALTKEQRFLDIYEELTKKPHRTNLRNSQWFGLTFCLTQSMIFFSYAAIFRFGAYLVAHDGLHYQGMFIVFLAVVFGAITLGRESQFGPDIGKAKTAACRIFALLDRHPGAADAYSTEGLKPATCKGEIEFQEAQFSYPTRASVMVLKGLNLRVEKGNTIALVGSSGCGKSTTVQLLERFYDASQGRVCLDGTDVTTMNVAWLRAQMGLVSQEPVLFDYSIRENIAYGDNSREVTMDEIIEAAKQANIHNFISSLPNGYETRAGDKGTQLSGGQKQRVAIARALLRNPKILLLDEATSALDTESEKIVQDALDRAQRGRTSIVIAHRLSTIQNASCIYVFHNGKIVEQGTHVELMALKSRYYKLNVAQGNRK